MRPRKIWINCVCAMLSICLFQACGESVLESPINIEPSDILSLNVSPADNMRANGQDTLRVTARIPAEADSVFHVIEFETTLGEFQETGQRFIIVNENKRKVSVRATRRDDGDPDGLFADVILKGGFVAGKSVVSATVDSFLAQEEVTINKVNEGELIQFTLSEIKLDADSLDSETLTVKIPEMLGPQNVAFETNHVTVLNMQDEEIESILLDVRQGDYWGKQIRVRSGRISKDGWFRATMLGLSVKQNIELNHAYAQHLDGFIESKTVTDNVLEANLRVEPKRNSGVASLGTRVHLEVVSPDRGDTGKLFLPSRANVLENGLDSLTVTTNESGVAEVIFKVALDSVQVSELKIKAQPETGAGTFEDKGFEFSIQTGK